MNTEAILKELENMDSRKLEALFNAILSAELKSEEYVIREARVLNSFKRIISKNAA